MGAIFSHRGGREGAVGCIPVLNWWLEYREQVCKKFQVNRMKCKVRPFFVSSLAAVLLGFHLSFHVFLLFSRSLIPVGLLLLIPRSLSHLAASIQIESVKASTEQLIVASRATLSHYFKFSKSFVHLPRTTRTFC